MLFFSYFLPILAEANATLQGNPASNQCLEKKEFIVELQQAILFTWARFYFKQYSIPKDQGR